MLSMSDYNDILCSTITLWDANVDTPSKNTTIKVVSMKIQTDVMEI